MIFKFRERSVGDMRIIRRFLLWPRTIDNEMRWWELVYIKQQTYKEWGFMDYEYVWRDYSWSDESEYIKYLKDKEPDVVRIQ